MRVHYLQKTVGKQDTSKTLLCLKLITRTIKISVANMGSQALPDTPIIDDSGVLPKTILAVSLARYLVGEDITDVIEKDWSLKATPQQQRAFDNQGFNLDPTNVEGTLEALKARLEMKPLDGVIVGWCTRGHKEFTVLFERVVNLVTKEIVRREQQALPEGGNGLELMFCEGPDDLVNTTLRTFGQ